MTTRNAVAMPVILVVEDEPLLRMTAMDMIEDAGFAVVGAANADEAIGIIERRDDIRVVFTDIEMPGSMNGLALVAAIRRRRPPIRLIVTSGKLTVAETDLPPQAWFFSKPYEQHKLVAALQGATA